MTWFLVFIHCVKCPNTEFFLIRIFPHSDEKKVCIWSLFIECPFTIFKKWSISPLPYFIYHAWNIDTKVCVYDVTT